MIELELTIEQAAFLKSILGIIAVNEKSEILGALYQDLEDNDVPNVNIEMLTPITYINIV